MDGREGPQVMALPLEGITVVAVEQAAAAPFATRQLADLGARVIKVERPDGGDFARHYDDAVEGQSAYFVWLNRSKESLVLDLKQPSPRRELRRLVDGADVFVQNLSPGAAARLGLSPASLRRRNPRLVTCSITGFSPNSPLSQRRAYDLLVQAESGLLSVTGTPAQPSRVGISIADIATGMYAFSGILAALYQRERTGTGTHLDIAMFDALLEWMSEPLVRTMGQGAPPPRSGPNHPSIAPYGPVATRDGNLFIGIQNQREWVRLCEQVLKRPELATDPRFATNAVRVRNRRALSAEIERASRRLGAAALAAKLTAAQVAFASLTDIADLANHPAVRERLTSVSTPTGSAPAVLPPLHSRNWPAPMGPVPGLGGET
jgi:itaconate CoA-transferase